MNLFKNIPMNIHDDVHFECINTDFCMGGSIPSHWIYKPFFLLKANNIEYRIISVPFQGAEIFRKANRVSTNGILDKLFFFIS